MAFNMPSLMQKMMEFRLREWQKSGLKGKFIGQLNCRKLQGPVNSKMYIENKSQKIKIVFMLPIS